MPRHLDETLTSDIFRQFRLEATDAPTLVEGARAWHCFRPMHPAAHDDIEVDLLVDARGEIIDVSLGLDRRAIDEPRATLPARDITASFLAWAVPAPAPVLHDLITRIVGGPAADATGGHAVFVGAQTWTAFKADTAILAFENKDGVLPHRFFAPGEVAAGEADGKTERRWLKVDVHYLDGAGAADKTPFHFKIMRSPTQCVLWKRPERVNASGFFDVRKDIVSGSHLERTLFACRECGQKYFYEWYEEVDWEDGNDKMYSTYIPVETDVELAELEQASVFDLMAYYPRLHADGNACWRTLGDDPTQE